MIRIFPISGRDWTDYRQNPKIVGADEGAAGIGGWHYQRSETHIHRGIDLGGETATPLLAVQSGVLQFKSAFEDPAKIGFHYGGHRIYLTTDDGVFSYFHLGNGNEAVLSAAPKDIIDGTKTVVNAGELIGLLGYSGGSVADAAPIFEDNSHLHLEHHPHGLMRSDVNPKHYLVGCKKKYV